jgi:diguanylate cyclase
MIRSVSCVERFTSHASYRDARVSVLPLAEQTDLIDHLTEWVLRTALDELHSLDEAVGGELTMSVNVSARTVGRTDFPALAIDTLREVGMDPKRLTIEVTETALLSDPPRAAKVLGELAAAGVSISLDDFGQGRHRLGTCRRCRSTS